MHQLRLHRAPACRSACRSPASASTTSACCRSRAPGKRCGRRRGRGRSRRPPEPRTPCRTLRSDRRARQSRDRAPARAAALDASEHALWRMMSFYGTPLDDLDAAIAADPAWLLPRVMKAGFLLSLTEPVARSARRGPLLDAAEPLAAGANERERGHLAALRRVAARRLAAAPPTPGARCCAAGRATCWPCSGRYLFDFYRGDAEALRERVAAVLPAWSGDDPLHPYVLGHARLRPRGIGPLRRGRGGRPAGAGRRGARAVGDPRRRPRDGDAGPARRGRRLDGDLAAVLGPRATASPATSAGTRRCSRSRRSTTPRRSSVFDLYLARRARTRSRCSASTPRRCSGGCSCTAPTSATAGSACVAGWPLDDAGRRPALGLQRRARAARAARRRRARRGRALGRARRSPSAERARPAGTARSARDRGRAADAGPARLRRRPLRRRRAAARAAARRRRRAPRRQPRAARRDRPDAARRRGARRRRRRRPRAARRARCAAGRRTPLTDWWAAQLGRRDPTP